MRAVALAPGGRTELVDLPEPEDEGTLVHVRACGLCGSDVEKLGSAAPGLVLGHEVAGELDDGTRVTVAHRVSCGECDRCRAGHESTCTVFARLRIHPGGFGERLRATHVVPVPDAFGALDALWVEPLACVLRAAGHVPRGRTLVVGCGAIGRLWVQALARRGHEVVVSDPRRERVDAACRLGAGSDEGPVDAAVVTAVAGANAALERLEPGGTLLLFAAAAGPTPVELEVVYRRELTVVGSRSATLAAFRLAMEALPGFELPDVVTLPLERFAEGVELYRRGDALKVAFTP